MEIFALIAVCAVVWWIASQMGHKTPPKHPTARPRPSTLPKQVRPTRKTAAPSATASRRPPKSSTPEVGEKLEGPAYIIDGDSLRIQKTEIRLFGVDAQEINHPYGQRAKEPNGNFLNCVRASGSQQKLRQLIISDEQSQNATYQTEQMCPQKWSDKDTRSTGHANLAAFTHT